MGQGEASGTGQLKVLEINNRAVQAHQPQLICKPITLSNHIIAGLERLAHLYVHRQHALQGAHSLSPASSHQVRGVLPSAHAKKHKTKNRALPGLDKAGP